ncbi:hypothetical protein UFOVP1229_5 [uncultured Caudovirales phage]|uniref:HNH nuclease n=1 Tax=uncultured Caudovirales phage TaxID=2100421 RepID=A0A6J5RH86_9CAUD|nr:hypothetical protein UFOVP1229_5 [uncultured Caudovirales phage]
MADANRICSVEGCNRKVKYRGLCGVHVTRLERHGDPLAEPKKKTPPQKPERLCSIDGCENIHKGHGYCDKHLARFKKFGDANYIPRTEPGSLMKFIHSQPETDGCIIWPFSVDSSGYGQVSVGGRNLVLAHRYSLSLYCSPLDPNSHACHTCDTPRCINHNHLYWGNRESNTEDMVLRGRSCRGEKCHWAILTETDVREIFRLREAMAMTQQQIADRFNVDDSTIWSILCGKSWRFVYDELTTDSTKKTEPSSRQPIPLG